MFKFIQNLVPKSDNKVKLNLLDELNSSEFWAFARQKFPNSIFSLIHTKTLLSPGRKSRTEEVEKEATNEKHKFGRLPWFTRSKRTANTKLLRNLNFYLVLHLPRSLHFKCLAANSILTWFFSSFLALCLFSVDFMCAIQHNTTTIATARYCSTLDSDVSRSTDRRNLRKNSRGIAWARRRDLQQGCRRDSWMAWEAAASSQRHG